jgi:hypothetical protein
MLGFLFGIMCGMVIQVYKQDIEIFIKDLMVKYHNNKDL